MNIQPFHPVRFWNTWKFHHGYPCRIASKPSWQVALLFSSLCILKHPVCTIPDV